MPQSTTKNLDRLSRAMVALNAFLRIAGMSESEARSLPVPIDAELLARTQVSTWMTDAGPPDILMDIPDRRVGPALVPRLLCRSKPRLAHGVTVQIADLDDVIESKEFADRPKDDDAFNELRSLRRQRR